MGRAALVAAGAATLASAARAADATAAETAVAAAVRYEVKIVAPAPLDALLEKNLDLLRFQGNARIDREQLQRLVRAAPEQVKALLATAGFYTPQVSARLDADAATPTVVVSVEPGEPVLVGKVELELRGFDAPARDGEARFNTRALRAAWRLHEGARFRQADWEAAKRNLLRQVVQTRYPRAQLSETLATVDPDSHRAELRVVLDSGPELRFGALRIEGLRRYPETIVRNLNQIEPGAYYSEAALQALQSRLQDTGYFSAVEVSADLSGLLNEQIDAAEEAQPGAAKAAPAATVEPVPLVVRVVENKRKNVSAGVGYSTNTGNRAQLNYDDLNLLGLKFKSALTLETKKQTARGDFYFPTTPEGYNDSIGASFERSDIENETTRIETLAAKRAWGTPLLERSITLEFLNENKTVAGAAASQSKSLPLTYSLTKRQLDNLLFPTSGYVVNAQLGGAPLPLLTDELFVRGSAKFVYYQPLGKSGTLILRGEAGVLASKEKPGVPAVYLFRAGGDQSVRGYAYRELGVQEGQATVGGRYLATAGAEYQHWLTPTWGAALFYDAGNAADSVKQLHPKSGYGLGVRYKSPVGPINVDAAYGHAIQKYRLHFSLGFTF
ncbi:MULTISPECIES: autotransporter assembly complex protein TamA [unclassified Janthinobacterium]|uniref:autotransporter assembly complex protein TamA n=1 Tax=unclassified Janthinobacterium TaxID=2610881 RepID=UPI000379C7FF|nr:MULTISPECIES: autotransporter assembly complex family protein [unclassified Janthinobacterium]MEC5159212.1 translocation and assembly module TamA [Janthinobacterium sp. CG_S6]